MFIPLAHTPWLEQTGSGRDVEVRNRSLQEAGPEVLGTRNTRKAVHGRKHQVMLREKSICRSWEGAKTRVSHKENREKSGSCC